MLSKKNISMLFSAGQLAGKQKQSLLKFGIFYSYNNSEVKGKWSHLC